jgi:hypothetical protein
VFLALGLLISCASFAADKKRDEAAPAEQLVLTDAASLSPEELTQVETQTADGAPLAIAGYGLVFEVRSPANVTMVTEDGNLVVSRTVGAKAVTRATIVVGSGAATKAPALVGETTRYETGPSGPTIKLEAHVSSLDQVFSMVAPMPGQSSNWGKWRVVAEGPVSFALQPGTSLMTVPPGREMQFVVALGTSMHDHVWLTGPFKKSATLDQLVFEGAREAGRGKLGNVQWLDLRYTDQGQRFAQRLFLVPYGTESILLLKARAHEEINDRMVQVASEMVRTYASGVEGP